MEIDQKDLTGSSPQRFLWLEENNRGFVEPDELFDRDESESTEPSQPRRLSKPKQKLLPAILERQLIERWQKLSDVKARNRVVEAHLGLVGNLAKKFSTSGSLGWATDSDNRDGLYGKLGLLMRM